MKKGLIAASAECSVYNKAMRLMKRNSSDRYIWECRKRGENGHCMKRSVRKNRWFEVTTRGLLATDHVILNHGQVTWTTPELAPSSPNYHTTPTGGRFSSRQI
ncbi:hypothetical protein TNCV_1443901 [Trichonephila clavipes]|nr:hypothetical protein TNCV_1443901 [Trichonephila clavipes]